LKANVGLTNEFIVALIIEDRGNMNGTIGNSHQCINGEREREETEERKRGREDRERGSILEVYVCVC
jgi:hypothetical protein